MEFFERHKEDMIAYVKAKLDQCDTAGNPRKFKIGYSRFEHTMRVYKWMQTLYAAYPDNATIDLEALSIATICEEDVTFESILTHMEKYTLQIMQHNPMRTHEGIKIWNEKKMLTEAFVEAYRKDINTSFSEKSFH